MVQKSPTVCVCVCVCDLENQQGGDLGPFWAVAPQKNKDNALGKGEWSVPSCSLFVAELRPQTPPEEEDGFHNWSVRFWGSDKYLFSARNLNMVTPSSNP
jgi:hypothetical protein